jgi:hypothetical protein
MLQTQLPLISLNTLNQRLYNEPTNSTPLLKQPDRFTKGTTATLSPSPPALAALYQNMQSAALQLPSLGKQAQVHTSELSTAQSKGITVQPNPYCPGYQLLMGEDARLQLQCQGQDLMVSFKGNNMAYLSPESQQVIGGQAKSPGGSRFLEPWPQSWAWPPKEDLTHGPLNMSYLRLPNQALAVASQLPEKLQALSSSRFQCVPSSLMSIQPDGSFMLGFQQQLTHDSSEGRAAWWVAPLVTKDESNPLAGEAQVIFPAVPEELPPWLTHSGKEGRWSWDGDNQLVTVRSGAYLSDDQEKVTTASSNWAMLGKPGDSKVLLLQSQGKHPDHFQIYGLGGETPYLEVEWTGPLKHQSGERSELMVKGEWLPLASLNLPFTYLADGETLTQQLNMIGRSLKGALKK